MISGVIFEGGGIEKSEEQQGTLPAHRPGVQGVEVTGKEALKSVH